MQPASAPAAPAPVGPAAAATPSRSLFERLPWKVRLAIFLPVFATAGITLGVGALMVYYAFVLPDAHAILSLERARFAAQAPVPAAQAAARDDAALEQLPAHVRDAVVASEDRRFFAHRGLDPTGFLRATFANLLAGRLAPGNATLTQRLAARLAAHSGLAWSPTLEELTLTLWLEARLTKHEILELYIYSAHFGGDAYGIEAAARRTFAKSARELTLGEAAVIAGLLEPSTEPATSAEAARVRGRVVLAKMLEAGLISAEAERRAASETITFAVPRRGEDEIELLLARIPPAGASHAVMSLSTSEKVAPTANRATSRSKAPPYPTKAIDADLIARALRDESAAKTAASMPRSRAVTRPEIEVGKPGGLMSLGVVPR
jgi:membrane peptidoglycan carboxypeptidase